MNLITLTNLKYNECKGEEMIIDELELIKFKLLFDNKVKEDETI